MSGYCFWGLAAWILFGVFITAAQKLRERRNRMRSMAEKLIPKSELQLLVVNVCDHCNLNCWGCDHFSPLSPARFEDPDRIRKDLNRLHELIGDRVKIFSVMGGEPLLHPRINEILNSVSEVFPESEIRLDTNGTLLMKMDDDFFRICREKNVMLVVTKYPIEFDYDRAAEMLSSKGVRFRCGPEGIKTSYHLPLDLAGGQDPRQSFMSCFHVDSCQMLTEGRIWPCTVAPNMHIFADCFGKELPMTEEDGIDLYTIGSGKELFEKLVTPMPACRFCNIGKRTFNHPWKVSGKKMEEWTL